MINEELQKKIDKSIKLLRLFNDESNPVELAYSGGKDSDVILQLAKEAGINYRAIHRCTTIDPPGTMQHVREMNVEIVMPKKTFLEIVSEKGMPSRFARFCCSYLKEYKILDKVIVGVRKSESKKRAQLYKEPTICKVYSKSERVEQVLPILDWTDKDVEDFIRDRNIKCADIYYKNGVFDVKQRLGCIGCPLASKNKRLEQLKKILN